MTEFINQANKGRSNDGFTEVELFSNIHVYDVTQKPCALLKKINESQGLNDEVIQ